MRIIWILAAGVAAAGAYGFLSWALADAWNAINMAVVGALAALVGAGVRRHSPVGAAYAAAGATPPAAAPAVRSGEGGENPRPSPAPRAESVAPRTSPERADAAAKPAPSAVGAAADRVGDSGESPLPARPVSVSAQGANRAAPPAKPEARSSADECWEKARTIVHNVIPDQTKDAEYLALVHNAAEAGHVDALAKLGEYALRRGMFVEAYFWTKTARRRQEIADKWQVEKLLEIDDQLEAIRRRWRRTGRDPELRNTYEGYSLARGELARALLKMDVDGEVERMRKLVKDLADGGNADAALFVR